MATSFSRKGIMALEGLEDMDGTMGPTQPIHDHEEMVENDLIDMGEASTQAIAVDDASGEAIDTVDALAGIESHLGEAVESGEGISAPVAQALTAAVEHFNERMGYRPRKAMPALESYGGRMSKRGATQLAMESIGEGVKRVMAAIVAAFKRVMEWVGKFFISFTHAAKKLGDRADAIAAQAKKGMTEGTFVIKKDDAGFTKHLVSGGIMQRPESFSKTAQAYIDQASKDHAVLYAGAEDLVKGSATLKSVIEKGEIVIADFENVNEHVLISASKSIKSAIDGFTPIVNESAHAAEGTVLFENPLPFGSVSKFAVIPKPVKEKEKLMAAMSHFSMYIAKTTGMSESTESEKDVVCLQKTDIEALCGKISASMKTNAAEKRLIKTMTDAGKFFDAVSSGLNHSRVINESEEHAMRTHLAKLAGTVSKVISAYATKFLSTSLHYEATVCKATLDYCAASLKQSAKPPVKAV